MTITLRIRPDHDGKLVSVWLVEGKDVTQGLLHGIMLATMADELAKVLGVTAVYDSVPSLPPAHTEEKQRQDDLFAGQE